MEIPGYQIIERIGEGGMATVWKAKQTALDRLVALKVLNTKLFKNPDDIDRFRREAQATAQLRHPGLCQIYDAGESGGTVYYAMEYVAGFSVGDLLMRKGDLPEKQALMVAYGVAGVLDAIWEKNRAIHCDIKPDNVLIDQEGAIRVTDLGLARVMGQVVHQVDANYIVGTPNYASPEQARGQEDLDFRTDIYALGATLYHMLTGMMPFADSAGDVAMERQISDYIADPQRINPLISNGAAWLVEKMMIKDRTLRYANWSDVLRDIEEVRAGRLPLGDLPSVGQSTVSRMEERERATQKALLAMRPKIGSSPASQPVMPRGMRRGGGRQQGGPLKLARPAVTRPTLDSFDTDTRGKDRLSAALRTTLFLGLFTGLTYFVIFYFIPRWPPASPPEPRPAAPSVEREKPPEMRRIPEAVHSSVSAPREIPPPPVRANPIRTVPAPVVQRPAPVQAPPVASTPAETAQREAWDDPRYVRAMTLLRDADSRFQQFIKDRNQAHLQGIEAEVREAIRLFESCRSEAPPQARVGDHIRSAYQMISGIRNSRVLGN